MRTECRHSSGLAANAFAPASRFPHGSRQVPIGSDAEQQEALVITANPERSDCIGNLKCHSSPCAERPDNNLSIPAELGQYCTGQLTLRTVGLYCLSSAMVSQ